MKLTAFPVLAAALALAVSPAAAKRRNPDPTMRVLADPTSARGDPHRGRDHPCARKGDRARAGDPRAPM